MIKYETDSRKIKPGQTFVAIKGHTVDGHDYIENAIKNGATKIIAEKNIPCSIPLEIVANTNKFLEEALKEEYGSTLSSLKIIGITGTNGKTTTCYLIYQLLNELNENTAYLGTLGFITPKKSITTENTTPDILTTYKFLLEAKESGIETIVMEISSHALEFNRIYGLSLTVAAFTNLTEDHLDYHKTMENYLKAKLKIINYLKQDGILILNGDDENSQEFAKLFSNYETLGFNEKFTYNITSTFTTPAKTTIDFTYKNTNYQAITNLTSKFNIYNYITALAIIHALGYDINTIITATTKIKAPKGRCETHEVNKGYAVIDYAHTPDAVEKVITAYNELKKNKLITIIGCGGDRDPIKRPIMGNIATSLSDYCIFTTDNPRTEDPDKIMQDITKDLTKNNYQIIKDRKTAIKTGIEMLNPEDILLILGKGHEDYQIIGHEKIHLDDAEEVENWIKTHKKTD